MILTLFIFLVVLSLGLVVLSYATNESAYGVVGWIFLFFLSFNIMSLGHVELKTGTNVTIDTNQVNITTEQHLDTYTSFDDSTSAWLGRWLAIISIIGFFITVVEIRNSRMARWRDG